ncbi:MAG: hypothetical protein JO121_22235 [Deltaproteobacteria bacterium]|nr:hypothetical protein [Deltaproteobacteria bacterium]
MMAGGDNTNWWFRRVAPLLPLGVTLLAAGCAPQSSALSTARSEMRAGHYTTAHRELTELEEHPEKLSPDELREVKDDLCVTDFTIGRPTYSVREQQRVCTEAAAEPGSQSADVLARIDGAIEQADNDRVTAAIKAGDLAGAETAVEDYESLPGANQVQVASWSNQMWKLVEQKDQRPTRSHKAALGSAIATLKRQHADARKMNDAAFKRWVVQTASVDGRPMVSDPRLEHGRLKLDLIETDLSAAALNLDKFALINDVVVARCGCDGRTDVGVGSGDLPAYVVRLDPETRASEVLILLSGANLGPAQGVSLR